MTDITPVWHAALARLVQLLEVELAQFDANMASAAKCRETLKLSKELLLCREALLMGHLP